MRILLPLVIVALLAGGCETDRGSLPVMTEIGFDKEGTLTFLRPDGSPITTIDIEVAETDSARVRGLMGRRSLPRQSGMLFVFDEEEPRSFWMRNTPLPLDILFVGADSAVVNIARRTTPFSDEQVPSDGPARFVVEVRAGFVDRYGLDEDTRVRWTLD